MTEKKGRLSKAGAAVVAPFAHMQPDACTHTDTHTQKPSLNSSTGNGFEQWRSWVCRTGTHAHTHTHRTPAPPLVDVSPPHRRSLWGVCCSTLLQGPGNAGVSHFSPLSTSIFGLDIEGPQPPSFSTVFQNTGSQCALFVWHSVPSLQIKTAGL